MSLSSPASLIPITLIVGLVMWGVWIQVRARIRAKRAVGDGERPGCPIDPHRRLQSEGRVLATQARFRDRSRGRRP